MNLTNLEKFELFRLIANRTANKRYKLDDAILKEIANKLAAEILDKDYVPSKEKE